MSDPRSFIQRWSRRKRAATEDTAGLKSAALPQAAAQDAGTLGVPPPFRGRSASNASRVGVNRNDLANRGDPHPTAFASLREAKAADLPLAGGGTPSSLPGICNSPAPQGGREQTELAARADRTSRESAVRDVAFDLTKLPPIESITAESDIRAFLSPGVPPELTRAALRRAWAADPKIRDFIGLSENSWDFNAPGAIPGFGPLEMTDELRRQIMRMVGRSLVDEAPDEPKHSPIEARDSQAKPESADQSVAMIPVILTPPTQSIPGTTQEPIKSDIPNYVDPIPQCNIDHTAEQHDSAKPDCAEPILKRLHGRALPE
jgi:uncharacterized protein DUF3306